MYSKKVIEEFQHPKNVGEIKNADGVGKVGNPVCLLPNTKIHINNNLKEIEKIDLNDKVIGHNGKYNKVIKTYKRDYSGKLIEIKNKLGKTILTPEHEVLAVKVPKRWKYSFSKNKKQLLAAWHHADELEKGDMITYPILKKLRDVKYINFLKKKKNMILGVKIFLIRLKLMKIF